MPQNRSSKADIILDARMIQHSGIGTYLQGLLSGFEGQTFFKNRRLGLAMNPSLTFTTGNHYTKLDFHSPIYSLREQFEYVSRLGACRLWHSPHYNIPWIKKKTRLVVTLHDLIHWIFRKEFLSPLQTLYAGAFFRKTVKTADKIIAVSEQTKKDLIHYFNAKPEKVRVIYEGVSENYFTGQSEENQSEVLKKYGLPGRFYLYVGLLKPHKNVLRLIRVFERLWKEGRLDASLVIAGKKDKKYKKEFAALGNLQTQGRLHYLPRVDSQKELAALYASSRALVHPSLYEGFGLTCLEAMASGTPVIASRAASLPEVVGEAGSYMDPTSEDSMAGAVLKLEGNETLRKTLIESGRKRARQFSWSNTARETLQVYEEILS